MENLVENDVLCFTTELNWFNGEYDVLWSRCSDRFSIGREEHGRRDEMGGVSLLHLKQ